jgi:hypothetical protein
MSWTVSRGPGRGTRYPSFCTSAESVPGASGGVQNGLFGCGRLPTVRLMVVAVPPVVERLLTADVAVEIAEVFTDNVIYPDRIVVDGPASGRPGLGRRFPGWPGPVLVLSDENQGVCSWGVPLGEGRCPVLVGGELLDAGEATVRYAASVEDFIAARRWDRRCLTSRPLLQAQAPELDEHSIGHLKALLSPAVATAGWPGSRQYRFQGLGVRVLLWSAAGQCDWWISADGEQHLRAFAAGLLALPGLRRTLWSNDDPGTRLLGELLGEDPR